MAGAGICEYFELDQWYHLSMVFAPRKAELWIDGTLVANMSLDLWNITDVEHGRIHLGHDPRYAFYERLLFGQVRLVLHRPPLSPIPPRSLANSLSSPLAPSRTRSIHPSLPLWCAVAQR